MKKQKYGNKNCHKNRCSKYNNAKRQTVVKSAIKWVAIAMAKTLIKHFIHRLFDGLF